MRKTLPTADRKNINRLPTWTDITDICFHKEEHFVFFFTLESNYIEFMTQMV